MKAALACCPRRRGEHPGPQPVPLPHGADGSPSRCAWSPSFLHSPAPRIHSAPAPQDLACCLYNLHLSPSRPGVATGPSRHWMAAAISGLSLSRRHRGMSPQSGPLQRRAAPCPRTHRVCPPLGPLVVLVGTSRTPTRADAAYGFHPLARRRLDLLHVLHRSCRARCPLRRRSRCQTSLLNLSDAPTQSLAAHTCPAIHPSTPDPPAGKGPS
mmetsp:Transcript_4042/g.9650  ORF Transcript_4042/g.9650 Transcript_4042/m.9650 type:complete len:212 (-) Transcript_4042:3686-4321(-)